jgi:hypothetical protein
LIKLGVPEEQVRYEFFGAATWLFGDATADADAGPEAADQGRPITVTFARSAVTVPWRESTFSLLALAEAAGLQPDASCRTGGVRVVRLPAERRATRSNPWNQTSGQVVSLLRPTGDQRHGGPISRSPTPSSLADQVREETVAPQADRLADHEELGAFVPRCSG